MDAPDRKLLDASLSRASMLTTLRARIRCAPKISADVRRGCGVGEIRALRQRRASESGHQRANEASPVPCDDATLTGLTERAERLVGEARKLMALYIAEVLGRPSAGPPSFGAQAALGRGWPSALARRVKPEQY
jgi:hypothetical protein